MATAGEEDRVGLLAAALGGPGLERIELLPQLGVMAANGQPVDDATIDATIAAMSGQLSQSQALDQDVNLVQENGKWLICS